MLDLFTVFTKSGISLCYLPNTDQDFRIPINNLIKNVILEGKETVTFDSNDLIVQYKLDNEFGLVFVVAYQKIIQLGYIQDFLLDVCEQFKQIFGATLHRRTLLQDIQLFDSFDKEYRAILQACERRANVSAKAPKQMRTFEQSQKSRKTVASMIQTTTNGDSKSSSSRKTNCIDKESIAQKDVVVNGDNVVREDLTEEILLANRAKMAQKLSKKKVDNKKSPKSPPPPVVKTGKKPRTWDLGGTQKDVNSLERTTEKRPTDSQIALMALNSGGGADSAMIGTMKGIVPDLEVVDDVDDDDDDDDNSAENELVGEKNHHIQQQQESNNQNRSSTKRNRSILGMFKHLVGGGRTLTRADLDVVLERMRDHLIQKNVAADIVHKLCESVARQLVGGQLATFERVQTVIRNCMTATLMQIVQPKRRVDILRDCIEARTRQRAYTITMCGVNGVGKSTNLAKICFWLVENEFRVLIAACDTFRAGAVEQLRTHVAHLNALHPASRHNGVKMVELYEKGYGKDAASIAMEAIRYANDCKFNVVLIDTAGRMQDNEPLMRALAKLIKVNEPDLVLFVGEALVGNEAVDQLVKFNQALADYSATSTPHLIDGIVLTKFDTIDDKVGAAISMTYVTGQPIVFVGTGQTYTDLKGLNPKTIVQTLIK